MTITDSGRFMEALERYMAVEFRKRDVASCLFSPVSQADVDAARAALKEQVDELLRRVFNQEGR